MITIHGITIKILEVKIRSFEIKSPHMDVSVFKVKMLNVGTCLCSCRCQKKIATISSLGAPNSQLLQHLDAWEKEGG